MHLRFLVSFFILVVHVSSMVNADGTSTPKSYSIVDLDSHDSQLLLNCKLTADDEYLPNTIRTKVKIEKATLIEYKLHFKNYGENPLLQNMTTNYRANKWARVTTAHGQTLLSLAFNYGILSMMTLTFGTTDLDIELVDSPAGCLGAATEEQKINLVRRLLARDFNPDGNITLIDDERVCHEVIIGQDGYASFKDRCYYKDPLHGTLQAQDDVDSNFWLTLLYVILVIIKFGLLFFGPSLFISSVMSMSQENVPYVVVLKDKLMKTICIAKKDTELPKKLNPKHLIDLRFERGFPKLKDSAHAVVPGQITKVKFSKYDILVDYKRTQTENVVDVGLLDSLFRTICKCKIRSVGPFYECCRSNALHGCPCCKGVYYPWLKFFRKFANAFLVLLIPFPYYIRIFVFYFAEYDEVMARKDVIAKNGLKEKYENSLIHYLTPTHTLFIVIYIIYGLTACLLAFLSRKHNETRLLRIIIGAFRDLQYLNWTETLSMLVSNILWPLRKFGFCGLLVGVIYWPIAVPLTVIVCLAYTLPTIYLTIRMIFYSKTAIIERARRKKKNKPYQVSSKCDQSMHMFNVDNLFGKDNTQDKALENNTDDLGLDDADDISPAEHYKFKDTISLASSILKYQTRNWKRFTVYTLCAMLSIATLYAVVIVMAEVVGCLVEVFVFTIMGIIVNAAAILKFVMLFIMIFIYSADCFNNVGKKYLKLNKTLFNEVKSKCKELAEVAAMPAELQENRGFKSEELGQQASYELSDDIAKKPKNHWLINDLVLFVDSQDMPRIPRALFEAVCSIRVAGVPGPVFRGLIEAFESFLKAVIFVLFVFIIVLTFGAVYKVSSTNQTLATMIGGFIPLILKSFISPPSPDVEVGTVSFKSKLEEVIKNFCQKWPIHDLPFEVLTKEELEAKPEEGKDEKDKDKNDNNAIEQTKYEAPTSRPHHAVDMIGSYLMRGDGEGINELTSLNDTESHWHGPLLELKHKPTEEKCVTIAEEDDPNAVDFLIYLPEKSDEIWLDEWSDVASKASRASKSRIDEV